MLPLISLIPAIASGFGTVGQLIMKYFPSAEDAAKVEAIKAEIKVIEDEIADKVREHDEIMQQLEINKLQAQSEDKFVARARPFAQWGVSVGTWVFFGITPLTLLICVLFWNAKIEPILTLLDTLSKSGYIGTFITIALGLYGIRGAEKGFNAWQDRKKSETECK